MTNHWGNRPLASRMCARGKEDGGLCATMGKDRNRWQEEVENRGLQSLLPSSQHRLQQITLGPLA